MLFQSEEIDWEQLEEALEKEQEVKNEQQIEQLIQQKLSLEELLQTKCRLVRFIQALGPSARTQIRADVIQHCLQLNKVKKVVPNLINPESVVKMASSRIAKMIKNKKVKKNWSEEDVRILVWAISKYADLKEMTDVEKDLTDQDWNRIAYLIPAASPNNCMFKWLSIKKTNLSVEYWAQGESNRLRSIVEQQLLKVPITKVDWRVVCEKLYTFDQKNKIFRSPKQCREHWSCYLNPFLKKGPWNLNEDIKLLQLILANGGKKWSQIVMNFEGRTENALKNRYTLLLDKQRRLSRSKPEKSLIQDALIRCQQLQSLQPTQVCQSPCDTLLEQVLSPEPQVKEQSLQNESEQQRCSRVVVKICGWDQMIRLREIARSREVRAGYFSNGNFQPML